MANAKPRKDQHGKPSGPLTEFFLAANEQYRKGECIPLNINGHREFVVVGQRNKLPAEALEVLQNAKSKTAVVDLDKYDPRKGGTPRKQEDFYRPEMKHVYQSDFEIEVLKVHD